MLAKNNRKKLTVVEAAAIMDVDPQFLRIALQQGRFPFGTAVKMRGRFSYYINAKRFYDYLAGLDQKDRERVVGRQGAVNL